MMMTMMSEISVHFLIFISAMIMIICKEDTSPKDKLSISLQRKCSFDEKQGCLTGYTRYGYFRDRFLFSVPDATDGKTITFGMVSPDHPVNTRYQASEPGLFGIFGRGCPP